MEDSIEIAFQNDTSNMQYIVDDELEENLRDFHYTDEEDVDIEMHKGHAIENNDEEHMSHDSDDEAEFVDSAETSPEEEFDELYSD